MKTENFLESRRSIVFVISLNRLNFEFEVNAAKRFARSQRGHQRYRAKSTARIVTLIGDQIFRLFFEQDRSVKCHNCGTPNHLQKVCMRAKQVPANQVEEIIVEHQRFRDKFFETITVEGERLRFEIDSGAAVIIVGTHTLQKYFPFKQLQPTTLQLITFCKTQISIVDVVPVMVSRGKELN